MTSTKFNISLRVSSIKFGILITFVCGVLSLNADAQSQSNDQELLNEYEPNLGQMVSFLGKIYNTLGSDKATAKEKNTIHESSYLKVFKNERVQIEDDLFAGRSTLVIKDVKSYLQDIDIFYRKASFELNIVEKKVITNVKNQTFFKLVVNQTLNGTTTNGKSVSMEKIRFIEIELDQSNRDLKISSIYSKVVNKNQSLDKWWESLTFEWKVIFQRAIKSNEKPSNEQLKQIISLEKLDVSYNKFIQNIEPLAMVNNLREIDLSNTDVDDISVLRNNQQLELLNLSNSKVSDISILKFSNNLKFLFIENTKVKDLSPLHNLQVLEKVLCKGTPVSNGEMKLLAVTNPNKVQVIAEETQSLKWWNGLPLVWRERLSLDVKFAASLPNESELSKIQGLKKLSLNGNPNIENLLPVTGLKYLKELNCANSGIVSLDGIDSLKYLEDLDIANTKIADISMLVSMNRLKILRCDNTKVPVDRLEDFKRKRPDVLVMNHFIDIVSWWIKVPEQWQKILMDHIGYKGALPIPIEKLYDIEKIQHLDISDRDDIEDLSPLIMIRGLRSLNIANTMKVNSIQPLDTLHLLETLICSGNPISDLSPLSKLYHLKFLDIKNTPVSSIEPLADLNELEELDISATKISNLKGLRALENMKRLKCYNTNVSSLNPLITLVHLESLLCYNTKLSKNKIDDFKKIKPDCHIIFY